MRKSILFGGSILCLFILVSLSYQPIVADDDIIDNSILEIFTSNNSTRHIKIRYFFGEAHNCYNGENGSEFESNNVIEIRYWNVEDTESGIRFFHHKGNYGFGFGSGWKFYGIMKEGFICGFFYAKYEL